MKTLTTEDLRVRTATVFSVFLALLFLSLSLVINYYASTFASSHVSNSVTDIVLNNTRAYDVDGIFIYGSLVLWIFVTVLLLIKIHYAPFIVKSIALFVLIRSLSICLTHIAPFPGELAISLPHFMKAFTFGGDLFFSAHTGLPFLLALLFWHKKELRFIFLFSALLFAFVVLLGHYHYSIDVFAAFFITPTIAWIAKYLFMKDYELFIEKN